MEHTPDAASPLDIPVMPCPFCGGAPKSVGRPKTDGEKNAEDDQFVHFIACYCGGRMATAHMMGSGITALSAKSEAVTRWNARHNAEVTGA